MKRVFDIVVSASALAVLAPLGIAVAAAIFATSGRPVFFTQVRVGRNFQPFRLYKFRTMTQGKKRSTITAATDPDITPIGRLLRRTKLDELPQLWNILKGDMSLVGPRPEVPHYVELFRLPYAYLLTVRPGLTDWATLAFMDEERILANAHDPAACYTRYILPKKLGLSKLYVDHQSLVADLAILTKTTQKLLCL